MRRSKSSTFTYINKEGGASFVAMRLLFFVLLRPLLSTEGISRGKRPHVSIDSAFYDPTLLAVAESKEVDAR